MARVCGRASGAMLLFLNDDVMVQERGWDQAFAAALGHAEIGVTGAMLGIRAEVFRAGGRRGVPGEL